MSIKSTIKNTLKKGKEGLNIASDIAYKKYNTSILAGTIRNALAAASPSTTARMKTNYEDLKNKTLKEEKDRGLNPPKARKFFFGW
jgi:hypothetical protein